MVLELNVSRLHQRERFYFDKKIPYSNDLNVHFRLKLIYASENNFKNKGALHYTGFNVR